MQKQVELKQFAGAAKHKVTPGVIESAVASEGGKQFEGYRMVTLFF